MTAAIVRALTALGQMREKKPAKKKFILEQTGVALHLAVSRTALTDDERALDAQEMRHVLPPRKLKQVKIFKQVPLEQSRYSGEDLRVIRARTNTKEAERRRNRMKQAA